MAAQLLDRKHAPPIHPLTELIYLQPEELTLGHSTQAYLLRSFEQPVIRLDLVFPAGHWQQPQFGVSFHTAKLLSEGTETFTSKEFAEKIAYYGASLQADVSADRATITLLCLSKYFDELLNLVQEMWQKPLFHESELELLKNKTSQHVKVERQKNSYLANEALNVELFGEDHPYRGSLKLEEISAISQADILQFHQLAFLSKQPIVFLTGAIEDMHINALSAILPKSTIHIDKLVTPRIKKTSTTPKQLEVNGANHLQAAIKYGKHVPGPHSPDYYKLVVLNEALGGYFGSRLMRNLREEKGLTYGIHSYLQIREHAYAHLISTEVKADTSDLAITEINNELQTLSQFTISIEELLSIKNSLAGKFASERATIFDAMETIKYQILHKLPTTYYQELLSNITHTNPQDLLNFAETIFEPNSYTVIKAT